MSSTVSPDGSSTSPGIAEAEGEVEGEMGNNAVTMKEAMEEGECRQVMPADEEPNEAITARVLPSPVPPSRQEMLEHNITHTPYRSWCPHCVAGKAKSTKHSQGQGLEASEVPVVCMDYMFMGSKVEVDEDEEEDKGIVGDDDIGNEEADDTKAKILVMRDSKSKAMAAIPVKRKGVDGEDWALKESLRFLEFLGYTNVIMKSDQERALEALFNKIRTHRGDQTQTMREVSPVGDSKANGYVERSIQAVQGQIRTMKNALEARLGTKINTDSATFAWLVIHAANILNVFEMGKDGRTPFQRLRGRKMHPDLVEFGETIYYQPLKHLELGKAEARWDTGVFLGFKINSGEKVIATKDGIIKVRSIKRKLESERWNPIEHSWINQYPWKPYHNSEEDEVHIRPPQPVTPPVGQTMAPRQKDGEVVPKPFNILRKDLINYGYTPGCPGCHAAANDRKHKPHTAQCRIRLEQEMLEDESQSNRIKEARAREDAYLEQQIREADAPRIQAQNGEKVKAVPSVNAETIGAPEPTTMEPEADARMHWEDILNENNFHEIVNDDEEMYNAIENIPATDIDMASQIIGIVNNHVSEVWSQPRVTKLANEFKLDAGFALDIQTNDENGKPWDFDDPAQRARCVERVINEKPQFLIGSPMCTAFSALQALNQHRMDPAKWKALIEKGERHMRFAVKLYTIQVEAGRWFLHEHPNSATSWRMPEMVKLMETYDLAKTVAHMCRYGMYYKDHMGIGKVKKPTGFLTNSQYLRDQLSSKCLGGHRHVQLVGGRAIACQVYPDKLCRSILKGIRLELVNSGIIKGEYDDMMMVSHDDSAPEEFAYEFVDDISGQMLDTKLVREARGDEMKKFSQHTVYTKCPIAECVRVTGKQPIGTKWIDINKGDASNPNYRSRLVAKEIRRGPNEDMFAATPPLEAKKCLFSYVMSQYARGRCRKGSDKLKLLFVDVSRAYFYAPSRRPVYVNLPEEDYEPGMCGRLNVSMYGTQDAAANWENKYSSHLIANGFVRGQASPCVFWNPTTGVRCVVHGDDFTFAGTDNELEECAAMMRAEYDVKVRGKLGPDKDDDKAITILNRCVEWTSHGLLYEADPRHAEILIRELGLENTKPVVTPGVKSSLVPEDQDPFLEPAMATRFRQLIARCNFLCQDRADIIYATKEAARGMSSPRQSHMEKLLRIAKYLKGKPRYVVVFKKQREVFAINAYGDSDHAGEIDTRKSTSGGLVCVGDHVIKAWSSTQTVIALSSGEAELYALNKAAAQALGIQSLLNDLGINLEIRLHTDATTGRAIATRRGLGKVRHIAVNELWLQEKVANGQLTILKIKNKFNLADIMTKYLSNDEISQIVDFMQHEFMSGRSGAAPSLAMITCHDGDRM